MSDRKTYRVVGGGPLLADLIALDEHMKELRVIDPHDMSERRYLVRERFTTAWDIERVLVFDEAYRRALDVAAR